MTAPLSSPLPSAVDALAAIRAGGKPALARALTRAEAEASRPEVVRLLDAAANAPGGPVLGLTGPPGVGKSTLTNALIRRARAAGRSVGVIAVDPSSRVTGGALLGDRTRLKTDPDDHGIFVRSMAARDRLGGLSDHAIAAIALMRAVMDVTIVESVGIGQSEADVSFVADTVILCIQPGSGDSLQFMKAGVMEIPDVVCVTKADMGAVARRARADVEGALTLGVRDDPAWTPPVVMVSALLGTGLDDLGAAVTNHEQTIAIPATRTARHRTQMIHWVADAIRTRFGTAGLARIDPARLIDETGGPFSAIATASADLGRRLGA